MTRYTKEEIESTYQFKVTKRTVMREFNWITDLFVNEDILNEYYSIFLIAKIDPMKFCDEYGVKINWFLDPHLKEGDHVDKFGLSVIFDITYNDSKEIDDQINDLIHDIAKSPMPEELKLREDRRRMTLGDYEISSKEMLEIPKEYYTKIK